MVRRVLWSGLLIAVLLTVGDAEPAAACSCAGHGPLALEFEGEAIASSGVATLGRLWQFRVTTGGDGVALGAVVEVAIGGQDPQGADGLQTTSSCSIGPYPTPGGIYRVGAYQGSTPDGSPRLFANDCGGYMHEVAPPATSVAESAARVRAAEGTALGIGGLAVWIGVAALTVMVAASSRAVCRLRGSP